MARRLAWVPVFSLLSACAHSDVNDVKAPGARASDGRWVATWGAAVVKGEPPRAIADQTVREIVRVSLGGPRIRVRLSNAEGGAALQLGSAHVAVQREGASIAPDTDRTLTFGGVRDVTIAPGGSALSDPVNLPVDSSSALAVSLYLPGSVLATTEHSSGDTTYLAGPGDRTAASTLEGAKAADAWYFLSGVDVEAGTGAKAIVAIGDSLTDGFGSTPDAHHRWTDVLADRLKTWDASAPRAVVNVGISGNCLLRALVGPSGLDRLDRDVLDQPGAAFVIVLEGTNDIGAAVPKGGSPATVEQIVAGYRQIIARAHARGLNVVGATLPPFEGMEFEGFSWTPAGEEKREALNRWIRSSGAYDAVIDFDRAVGDPAHPSRLLPAFDSGDHGHPNDAGYAAMGTAIDLSIFRATHSAMPAPKPSVADSVVPAPRAPPKPIVKLPAGLVALQHVLLFDGTLSPPRPDQTIVVDHGHIVSVGPSTAFAPAPGMTVLDLAGRSVFPGLVGMHDHLYYIDVAGPRGHRVPFLPELAYTAPRLYLAGGVTTMRTTGSVEPYADLNLRREIDEGLTPGPDLDVTAPYLEGPGGAFPQMPVVKTADEARRFVAFWAGEGATSIKAYTHVSRDVLRAAIAEAHRHHLKVTGHLCSVTYAEAAALGIDNLEHGFFVASDFTSQKKPDECFDDDASPVLARGADDPDVRALLHSLVARHVAITSTLPVFEDSLAGRAPDPRAIELLEPALQQRYRDARKATDAEPTVRALADFRTDLALERAFVAAGGLLLAGPDPTGLGGVLPGFGDQRELELLVEAGFSAVEAIHIATFNGADYLGRLRTIGTVTPGKQADLVVVRGDPSARIQDVENVEWVFKHGVGYDPDALIDSVRGTVGLY